MLNKDIIEVLEDDFTEYAAPIIVNNLPSIDGLLPVHRKSIWGMYKAGLTHDKIFSKMLRATGYILPYYTFGDMPLAQALRNCTNNSLNYPYLMGKGNFGDKQRKDAKGASARYVECKLSEFAEDMLKGINKNNVPMKRNYDNTLDEPIILPSEIPNILVNTSQSIAVGESSKIPSHNLIEVCDSFINYIKTEDIDSTINILNGADFSIGGQIIYEPEVFKRIYKTGKGSFKLVGKYKYDKEENVITIYEVPYEGYIEDIEKELRAKIDKRFKEVIDIHDGTDKDGIALHIYVRKSTNIDDFIARLRTYTPFQKSFACNFTILDLDGKTPVLMNLETIINKWRDHRRECIRKEFNYEIKANSDKLERLYGLKIISVDLDKAIKLIRSSKSEKEAINKLIKEFNLTIPQSEYIATIRLVNINQDWISKQIKNILDLEKRVSLLKSIVDNNSKIDQVIIRQLEEAKKKYGIERKTTLLKDEVSVTIENTIEVEDYSCNIIYTKENYLKKTLRYSESQKVKDGDEIVSMIQTSNKGEVILFSNKQNAYKLQINDLENKQPSALGLYIPSLINIGKNENIIGCVATNNYKGFAIITYENGKIHKLPLESFRTNTKRSMLKNTLINSPIVSIIQIEEDTDIYLESSQNKALVINTENINEKASRNSQGVQIMHSNKGGFRVVKAELYKNQVSYDDYIVPKKSAGKLI
ncbi:DNA gyrase subunit A (plasmid) [Clostridium perfringens]